MSQSRLRPNARLLDPNYQDLKYKLCEPVLHAPRQVALVMDALRGGVVSLIRNPFSNLPKTEPHICVQVALVTDALRGGVVSLIRDLNGNHVIQRCLQRLGPEDSQFVYDAAAAHTLEIATHRHGCCVLQRCIDFATAPQKRRLVETIAAHALPLSQVCMPGSEGVR